MGWISKVETLNCKTCGASDIPRLAFFPDQTGKPTITSDIAVGSSWRCDDCGTIWFVTRYLFGLGWAREEG